MLPLDSLHADHGGKVNLQELAANVRICSAKGHIIAVKRENDTSENHVTHERGVLLMGDAPELLCLETKDVARSPNPIHQI